MLSVALIYFVKFIFNEFVLERLKHPYMKFASSAQSLFFPSSIRCLFFFTWAFVVFSHQCLQLFVTKINWSLT